MTGTDSRSPERTMLIERLVERENMLEAYSRVVGNKGAVASRAFFQRLPGLSSVDPLETIAGFPI